MMNETSILNIQQFNASFQGEGFYVNHFSDHLKTNHPAISKPHKHDFYLTVFFTTGTGFHEIDFKRYDVQRGSVFFLNPGQTHTWQFSDDIEGYIFFHSESFFNFNFNQNFLAIYPFYLSIRNSPHLLIAEDEMESYISRFENLIDEDVSTDFLKYRKITNIIDGLYIDFSRIYVLNSKNDVFHFKGESERIQQLEQLIKAHFLQEKSPNFYAEKMKISTKQLNRIVHQSLGKTTKMLITESVILEARKLLSTANMSLVEIAEHVGYDEYPYFSRLFKKHTDKTPFEFRSEYV